MVMSVKIILPKKCKSIIKIKAAYFCFRPFKGLLKVYGKVLCSLVSKRNPKLKIDLQKIKLINSVLVKGYNKSKRIEKNCYPNPNH